MSRFGRALAGAVVMMSAVLAVQCSGTGTGNDSGSNPSGLRVIATSQELMHAIIIPSSDAVFRLAGEQPKNDDDWQKVRVQALALAESGNLLMMPGRGPDTTTWNQMSIAMMDAASAAVKSADSRSVDALDAASQAIYESCDTCHNKYMKK